MISETIIAVQVAVGLIFLWSSLGKAAHPFAFFRALEAYGILLARVSIPLGSALVVLEAAVAFSHVTGWMLEWGMSIALFWT